MQRFSVERAGNQPSRFGALAWICLACAAVWPAAVSQAADGADAPRVLLVSAEPEYGTAKTLAKFADDVLKTKCGMTPTLLTGKLDHTIEGFADALPKADLLLLSIRRQALPKRDVEALRAYFAAGKPLLAIRTTSHAFDAKGKFPAGHVEWKKFDPEVLGGNYHGHHRPGVQAPIEAADGAADHAILRNVPLPLISKSSLYQVSPLVEGATTLLVGHIADQSPEPVAWTHRHGASRVFYTSLGGEDDFANPAFVVLLENAAYWALDRKRDEK